MKIYVQNKQCPSQVLFAFDEVVEPEVERIRWAVAYTTFKGCQRLVTRLTQRMGVRQWDRSPKTFITSLDFGLTEPAALEYLAAMPASEVLIANSSIATQSSLMPSDAYHPKIYLFDTDHSVGYVVGSANLTNAALLRNTEVVTVGHELPGNCIWDGVWSELIRATVPLGAVLLADYKKKWRRPSARRVEPDRTPPKPIISPAEKLVFWDAVSTRGLNPMDFDHLWVEAGPMSGGSRSQLELPRGANRFFDSSFSGYGPGQTVTVIGYPVLTIGSRQWTDRKLTWHGHNRMERINLPTASKGGFDYHRTAVLFRRHANGFEVNVLPWDDDGALAWRAASDALQLVFRLGEKGTRISGLF